MAKCKICIIKFDTEAELDEHFAKEHPKPPPTPCPESMTHVQPLMVEAMMPDRPDVSEEQREVYDKIDSILREWNIEYVNSMLTKLDEAGYEIVKVTK
jgi:hypothetical protein